MLALSHNRTAPHFAAPSDDHVASGNFELGQALERFWRHGVIAMRPNPTGDDVHRIDERYAADHVVRLVQRAAEWTGLQAHQLAQQCIGPPQWQSQATNSPFNLDITASSLQSTTH